MYQKDIQILNNQIELCKKAMTFFYQKNNVEEMKRNRLLMLEAIDRRKELENVNKEILLAETT